MKQRKDMRSCKQGIQFSAQATHITIPVRLVELLGLLPIAAAGHQRVPCVAAAGAAAARGEGSFVVSVR